MKLLQALVFCCSVCVAACGIGGPVYIKLNIQPDALQRQKQAAPQVQWQIELEPGFPVAFHHIDKERKALHLMDAPKAQTDLGLVVFSTKDGSVLWRYRAQEPNARLTPLSFDEKKVLVVETGKQRTVRALDSANGRSLWSTQVSQEAVFVGGAQASSVVLLAGKSGEIQAINTETGSVAWQRQCTSLDTVDLSLVNEDFIINCKSLVRLNAKSGAQKWALSVASASKPVIDVTDSRAAVIDSSKKLWSVALASGKSVSVQLNTKVNWTNIVQSTVGIFVRGIQGSKQVVALHNASTLAQNWQSAIPVVSTSNIQVINNSVFLASSSKLVSLNLKNGTPKWTQHLTDATGTYPLQLRAEPKHVIVIGETTLSKHKVSTGAREYLHHFKAVSNLNLHRLDRTMKQLRASIGVASSGPTNYSSNVFLSQMRASQQHAGQQFKLASKYRSMATRARSSGKYFDSRSYGLQSDFSRIKAQMHADQARQQGNRAIVMAGMNMMMQAVESQVRALNELLKGDLRRQELFRRNIFTLLPQSASAQYVYRPITNYFGYMDDFSGVSIVNQKTGTRKDLYLSPSYQEYGLWNYLDCNQGLLIHHGLGLNQAPQFSASAKAQGGVQYYKSRLIAYRVKCGK